jgi:hypothetical protein
MSRCVSDRTLWRLSEGEARREERDHVTSCSLCTTRLRRLEEELHDLQVILSSSPPSRGVPTEHPDLRRRRVAAVAMVAAMIMAAWFGVWWQRPSSPLAPEAPPASIWPFIEGVSAALFPSAEVGFGTTTDRLSDLDDLQAALGWEWPCDGRETLPYWACDDDPFALLLGEL